MLNRTHQRFQQLERWVSGASGFGPSLRSLLGPRVPLPRVEIAVVRRLHANATGPMRGHALWTVTHFIARWMMRRVMSAAGRPPRRVGIVAAPQFTSAVVVVWRRLVGHVRLAKLPVLLCGLLSSVWCPLGSTQAWVTGGWLWEGTLCVVVVAVGPKRCLRAMYFTAKSGDNLEELLAAARAETAPSKSVFCLQCTFKVEGQCQKNTHFQVRAARLHRRHSPGFCPCMLPPHARRRSLLPAVFPFLS